MKKISLKLIALSALFLFIIGFSGGIIARAETDEDYIATETETQTEDEEQEQSETEADKTLLEVAKDFIAPMIAGLGTSLTVVLPLAFMWLKSGMRSKSLNSAVEMLKKTNKEQDGRLKALLNIDYKAEFRDVAIGVLDEFASKLNKRFETTEGVIVEVLAEQKIDREILQRIVSALRSCWSGDDEIREILSQPVSPSALKKEVWKSERLKELITSIKGDEAEQLILEVEQSVEESE